MITTPSSNSSAIAGFGLWAMLWAALFKLDAMAKMLHIQKFVRRERILDWVNKNPALTLLGTEACNYGMHGITSALAVTFNLGGTLFNILMIFVILPLRRWFHQQDRTNNLLGRA